MTIMPKVVFTPLCDVVAAAASIQHSSGQGATRKRAGDSTPLHNTVQPCTTQIICRSPRPRLPR